MNQILKVVENQAWVSDQEFDSIFPNHCQIPSRVHWTPIEIAKLAAKLLVVDSTTRVLDVGSGVGKFCLVGALTTPGQFVGIEQRLHLVEVGQKLVQTFQIARVQFLSGDIRDLDWSQFHSFYLYNPFIENLYSPNDRIDHSIEFNEKRYLELVRWVQRRLHLLPMGTRVVTYHGFGGDMPPEYELKAEVPAQEDFIRLWVKTDHLKTLERD
jgi:predicted RNA methylase